MKSTGEISSWMDPSPFSRGGATENFNAYGDAYGTWHGKRVDSSARQVHIGAESSAWRDVHATIYEEKAKDACNNGLSYFQLPSPNLAMDECNASNPNSYDRYISQLVSCSTDPIVYYPATTCSSSAEEFNPANETTPMYFPSRNCYSTAQHGNLLYNVDDNYVDYMLCNKKGTSVDQYSDGKGSYAMESKADNNMKGNIGEGNFSVTAGSSSLGSDVTTRYSMDYSTELNHGLGTKQLNLPVSIASSSRPNSSLQISSEILDQPNLSVDSPCWKGASMLQHYSFGCGEVTDPQVKESKGSDDFDQGQKYLPVSGQYLRNSPFQEKGGDLVFHGSSSPSGNFSPNITLYGADKRFHGVNAEGSECAEIGMEKRSHFSCVICEKSIKANDSEKVSEVGNRNDKQLGQVRTAIFSANSPALVGEGVHADTGLVAKSSNLNLDPENNVRDFSVPGAVLGHVAKPIDSTDATGKYLTAGKDMRLLVKAIHGLSEVLLSSFCNGAVEWKECDRELVQQVIGNLETLTSRNKKGIPECRSHASGNERGVSQISISKSNDTDKNQCNTNTEDTEGKFLCIGSCMNNDKVSVKDLESDIFAKKEENPRKELYKNLWMQAEAAVCSMKYELQLTRMKLEMETNEFQTKKAKEPVQVMRTARLNSLHCSDTPACMATQRFLNDSSCLLENDEGKNIEVKPMEQKTKKDDKVESSVMARLEVLKGRYARSNNVSIEEQLKSSDTENTLKDLPTRLADLGFVESVTPQPFDDGNRDGFPSLPNGNLAVQHLVPIHTRENYVLHSETPGNTVGGVPLGRSADGPFPQPFLPSMGSQRNPMRFILG